MELRLARSGDSFARQAGALVAVALLVAGCATTGNQAGGSASPGSPSASSPSISPAASSAASSAEPSGSSPGTGFYLRTWQTQALAPQVTFAQLPSITIADGQFIDGRVAVPAIYPGPLWIGPSVRSISADGIASIVAEAQAAGLLGARHDFTDASLSGAVTGQMEMIVDGVTHDLTGPVSAPGGVPATPGTAAAFEAFWQKLANTTGWLAAALGPTAPYQPTRLAVLAIPPVEASSGIAPTETPWPLTAPFSTFGTAFGGTGGRCAVVSGADLTRLVALAKQSNQLTRFVDADGVKNSLLIRVLVPGEPSPCV
jgi:hypothetical protein